MAEQGLVSPFAPLAVSAYRRIWMASTLSHIGTFLQLTAAPWIMHELTRSPFMVALVTSALFAPRLLVTLPAGVLADGFDRRTMMLVGQSLSCVAAAALAVLTHQGRLGPTALLALMLVLGVGNALNGPSYQTLVPDLVPLRLRAQAITLNSAARQTARIVGPSLGGLLVAVGWTDVAFAANAGSYLFVIAVLVALPGATAVRRPRAALGASARAGIDHARRSPAVRRLLLVAALFTGAGASLTALLPSVVDSELGLGATGFGVLYGVFGAGALLAAGTRERAQARLRRRLLPSAIMLYGTAGVALGLAQSAWVGALAAGAAGVGWVWTTTTLNASVQLSAPDELRGRVVSLFVLAVAMKPVGAALAGSLAEVTGAGAAVALFCAATAVLGLYVVGMPLPTLAELAEPEVAADAGSEEVAR